MSIGEFESGRDESYEGTFIPDAGESAPASRSNRQRPLQRLAEVRRQQNVSLRNVARRMHVDTDTVRKQEEPTADIPLSVLYEWQAILEVPLASLLIDSDSQLSSPVEHRAKLVRVMKTAAAILERAEGPRMRRLAQMLVEQLIDLMPELKDVGAWNTVGRRRNQDDFGRIMERTVSDEVFRHSQDM